MSTIFAGVERHWMTSYVPTSFAESNFDEESLIARQKQKLGTLVSPSEVVNKVGNERCCLLESQAYYDYDVHLTPHPIHV
jgi:hypothetical protein